MCTVTTLRAPVHETISFVNYHINIGVDHLFMYFDDPDDLAIERLVGYEKVTCIRCDSHYWEARDCVRPEFIEDRQVFNANQALSTARERHLDWIIHIDSDELVYCETGLGNLLSNIRKNVDIVCFSMREAIPDKLKYRNIFQEIHDFKIPPTQIQQQNLQTKSFTHALYNGEYFRGHTGSKSAVRVASPVKSLHIHFPIEDLEKLTGIQVGDVLLLHYDCCDFEAWKTKCMRRIDGTATITRTFVRPNRHQQLDEFSRAHQDGYKTLSELYKRLYFVPEEERTTLAIMGLLSSISIDKHLFDVVKQ